MEEPCYLMEFYPWSLYLLLLPTVLVLIIIYFIIYSSKNTTSFTPKLLEYCFTLIVVDFFPSWSNTEQGIPEHPAGSLYNL